MHRSESNQLIPCAVCGTPVDSAVAPGYGFGTRSVVCWDCAMARGGTYDSGQEKWVTAPRIDDLVESDI